MQLEPRHSAHLHVGDHPVTLFLDRKIAARFFRRCPRPVEARIMPDSYVSSMGSAFTETAYPPTANRDGDRNLSRHPSGRRATGPAASAIFDAHNLDHPEKGDNEHREGNVILRP